MLRSTWITASCLVYFSLRALVSGSHVCLEPPSVANSNHTLTRGLRTGSQVVYTCNPSYTLVGRERLICSRRRRWHGTPPECVYDGEARCPSPALVAQGSFVSTSSSSEYVPGDSVSYTCDGGFYIDDYEDFSGLVYTIICGLDGHWSGNPFLCEELICSRLNPPDNGNIFPNNQTYFTEGQQVTYSCHEGYSLRGVHKRTCSLANRGWDSFAATECLRISCPSINSIENGDMPRRGRYLGDVVSFQCFSGFEMIGPTNRTCLDNWRWSGVPTTCENHDSACPIPAVPAGGFKIGNRYNLGNTVEFQCYSKLIQRGSVTRECLPTGEWSGTDPECEAQHAFDRPEDVVRTFRPAFDNLKYHTWSSDIDQSNRVPPTQQGRLLWKSLGGDGLDLYLVLDVSGSMHEHFNKCIAFAIKLVREVGISASSDSGGTRVGVLTFADSYSVSLRPEAADVITVEDVEERLQSLTMNAATGKGTCMTCVLEGLWRQVIPTSKRTMPHRIGAKMAVMFITDGQYNTRGSPAAEVEELVSRHPDIEIFSVGVSDNVDRQVLLDIAHPKDGHVYLFQHYNDLGVLVGLLTNGSEDYSACGITLDERKPTISRIVGGSDSKEGRWRWQAALYFGPLATSLEQKRREFEHNYKLSCGGTLIGKQWVLTAAHCMAEVHGSPNKTYVKLGVANMKEEASLVRQLQAVDVDWVYSHNSYSKDDNLVNDIALLHLSTPVVLDRFVGVACLPDDESLKSLKDMPENIMYAGYGTVTGWGKTKPRAENVRDFSGTTSPVLKEAQLIIQEDEVCFDSYGQDFPRGTFCAGYTDPENGTVRDTCQGDSGGPLVRELMVDKSTREKRWIHLGIVSWGRGCAQKDHYGIYTKTTDFVSWIRMAQRLYSTQRRHNNS